MHMIGHQYIGMYFEVIVESGCIKAVVIILVILGVKEDLLCRISPLNDVLRLIDQVISG